MGESRQYNYPDTIVQYINTVIELFRNPSYSTTPIINSDFSNANNDLDELLTIITSNTPYSAIEEISNYKTKNQITIQLKNEIISSIEDKRKPKPFHKVHHIKLRYP